MRAEAVGLDPPPGLSKFCAAPIDAPLPLVCKKNSLMGFAEMWRRECAGRLARVRGLGSSAGSILLSFAGGR